MRRSHPFYSFAFQRHYQLKAETESRHKIIAPFNPNWPQFPMRLFGLRKRAWKRDAKWWNVWGDDDVTDAQAAHTPTTFTIVRFTWNSITRLKPRQNNHRVIYCFETCFSIVVSRGSFSEQKEKLDEWARGGGCETIELGKSAQLSTLSSIRLLCAKPDRQKCALNRHILISAYR